jgi:hypothetical protein
MSKGLHIVHTLNCAPCHIGKGKKNTLVDGCCPDPFRLIPELGGRYSKFNLHMSEQTRPQEHGTISGSRIIILPMFKNSGQLLRNSKVNAMWNYWLRSGITGQRCVCVCSQNGPWVTWPHEPQLTKPF